MAWLRYRAAGGCYGKYYAPRWTSALPGQPIAAAASPPLKMEFPTGYAIKMVTVKTEISDGGDLGYALGTYEQPDGSWGAVADTFNVDPPP